MLARIAAVLAPTLIATAVGWAWGRFGPGIDRERTTDLILRIGAPALAFHGLVSADLAPEIIARMAGATAVALVCFALLGAGVLRLLGLPLHTFLAPLVFANTGNMGLPLSLFAFGEQGLALALCVYAVVALVQFTAGIAIWTGELSWSSLLRTPLSLAALLAAVVIALDWPVPEWILDTTGLLGDFAVPLMLLTLGMAIEEMRFRQFRRPALIAVLRLGLGCALGFGVCELLDLEGVPRAVLVLQCSMPVAVVNYLLAQRYGRSPDDVAGAIVISTLLSFALLPALLAYLLSAPAS